MENRIEKDSFGPIEVPAGHLWGAQTQRSLHHFHISTERMAPELVAALAQVKRAAAAVNRSLGKLPRDKADAIIAAADEVLDGRHPDEFPLAVQSTTVCGAALTAEAIPPTQFANGVKLAVLKPRLSAYS